MRKTAIGIFSLCFLLVFGGLELKADITVEMKSSISGIPILRMFEMNQTICVRGTEMITLTDGEIGVGDTSVDFRSSMYLDSKNHIVRSCDWQDSVCSVIDFSLLEQMLSSGLDNVILDSLMPYLKIASQYVSIDKADFLETGVTKKISGYNCRELAFNFEGKASPPIDKISGNFRFKINGSSWITDDFSRAGEYKKVMEGFRDSFLTPSVERILGKIMDALGLDRSLIDKYFEVWQYLYVETAMNIVLEVWSEGMDVPSMSFNIRFNSILLDVSFDKIANAVFEPPPGLELKNINLHDIIK